MTIIDPSILSLRWGHAKLECVRILVRLNLRVPLECDRLRRNVADTRAGHLLAQTVVLRRHHRGRSPRTRTARFTRMRTSGSGPRVDERARRRPRCAARGALSPPRRTRMRRPCARATCSLWARTCTPRSGLAECGAGMARPLHRLPQEGAAPGCAALQSVTVACGGGSGHSGRGSLLDFGALGVGERAARRLSRRRFRELLVDVAEVQLRQDRRPERRRDLQSCTLHAACLRVCGESLW